MIDNLATWKSTFAALPKTSDNTWAANVANWVDARVTNKANLTGVTNPAPEFTFGKAAFQTQLEALVPTVSQSGGVTAFAAAWEAAINASTMVIVAGAFIGPATPATTWSVVTSSVIDAASVLASKAKILDLIVAAVEDDIDNSVVPQVLRDAFLLLTGTVNGLDSVIPPGGPNPLIAAAVAFV